MPTDRLYKKDVSFSDALYIAIARVRLGPFLMIASIAGLLVISTGFQQALLVTGVSLFVAASLPFYNYLFPRLKFSSLARTEILFHVLAFVVVSAWWFTSNIWLLISFVICEIPLKLIYIIFFEYRLAKKYLGGRLGAKENRPLISDVWRGIQEGAPLTFANYIFRIPFAMHFPSGGMDPLYMLVAQAISSAYNLMLVVHSERILKFLAAFSKISTLVGVAIGMLLYALGFHFAAALAAVVFGSVQYAYWLSALPGKAGLLSYTGSGLFIVTLLFFMTVLAATVSPNLIWCALVVPFLHRAVLILGSNEKTL